jgi:hypothetical protein
MLTITTTALGILATWFFAWLYFRKSGSDLDAALRRLDGNHQKQLQALTAVARMLERSGNGKATYDTAGHLTGIFINESASDGAFVSDAAIVTHTKAPLPQYDRQHEQPLAPGDENDHA